MKRPAVIVIDDDVPSPKRCKVEVLPKLFKQTSLLSFFEKPKDNEPVHLEKTNLCLSCGREPVLLDQKVCNVCQGIAESSLQEALAPSASNEPLRTQSTVPKLLKFANGFSSTVSKIQSTLFSWVKDSPISKPITKVHNPTIKSAEKIDSPQKTKKFRPRAPKSGCPFYKMVPETNFVVDGFTYSCDNINEPIFFLTHFHSDHYGGLTKNWNRGLIYCSDVTANLVISKLGVAPAFLCRLTVKVETVINGVSVTPLDANHCPGAVLLLFQHSNGKCYLHCGDFRYDATLADHQLVGSLKINTLYLDTTYCNPSYTFPTQTEVIEKCLSIMSPEMSEPDTVIVVGSYTIGKERLFIAAAEKFKCKIFLSAEKYHIISQLNYSTEIMNKFTKIASQAKIHVVSMSGLSFPKLSMYVSKIGWPVSRAVAFRPTGWTGGFQQRKSGKLVVWNVPYSEHSSFTELKAFVKLVNPLSIVPTVNNTSTEAVAAMVQSLRD